MTCKIIRRPEAVVVAFSGIFDSAAVADIRSDLERVPTEGRSNVYVDLSEVTFIDSCAIGAVVFLFKRLAANGRTLFLSGLTGQPQQLIELLRIDRVVEVRSLPFASDVAVLVDRVA